MKKYEVAFVASLVLSFLLQSDSIGKTFVLHSGMIYASLKMRGRFGVKNARNIRKTLTYAAKIMASLMLASVITYAITTYFGISDSEKIGEKISTIEKEKAVVIGLVVPISEEMLFRGVLVPITGILGSSILFALAHFAYGSIQEIIGAFFGGLTFAYWYRKSGSIVPGMIAHLIYNAIAYVMVMG